MTVSRERQRTDATEFRIEQQQGGYHRLHVRGKMPIDWVSNLASGLARHGLSIIRGQAFREGAMTWHGHFTLKSSPHAAPVEKIDYHLLVKTTSATSETNLTLDSYTLRTTTERGGSLFLEIQGEDQIGFLGTFFAKLSFYSLFPLHLEIETIEGRILDRFWLGSAGGDNLQNPLLPSCGIRSVKCWRRFHNQHRMLRQRSGKGRLENDHRLQYRAHGQPIPAGTISWFHIICKRIIVVCA